MKNPLDFSIFLPKGKCDRLTAVLRYCEKSAKMMHFFRKKYYLSLKKTFTKLATSQSHQTLAVSWRETRRKPDLKIWLFKCRNWISKRENRRRIGEIRFFWCLRLESLKPKFKYWNLTIETWKAEFLIETWKAETGILEFLIGM